MLRIAEQNPHLYNRDVEKVVNAIFDEIEAALVRRDRVELRSFGAFIAKTWSARPGRNPKTGAKISVPATHHPSFRTGKEMRDRLNESAGSACAKHSISHSISWWFTASGCEIVTTGIAVLRGSPIMPKLIEARPIPHDNFWPRSCHILALPN